MLGKVKLTYHADRCGDVFAIPKAGTLVGDYLEGTSHGTPHPYDTHVPVLAFGAGVPALAKQDQKVSSLIVASMIPCALRSPSIAACALTPAGTASWGPYVDSRRWCLPCRSTGRGT